MALDLQGTTFRSVEIMLRIHLSVKDAPSRNSTARLLIFPSQVQPRRSPMRMNNSTRTSMFTTLLLAIRNCSDRTDLTDSSHERSRESLLIRFGQAAVSS